MNREILDTAIKLGAGRYRQGPDVLEHSGEEIARIGKKVFLLAGHHAFAAVQERLMPSLLAAGLQWELMLYQGFCSYEAAKAIAERCKETGCDVLCGIGGGVIMDLAKIAGEFADLKVVNIPTNGATCAAITTMSVIYTEEGAYHGNHRYDHDVEAVLVDTKVMAAQPTRYLAAGILDAMAKKIEMMNGRPELNLENTDYALYSAFRIAENTYDLLEKYGEKAIEDVGAQRLTREVDMVVFVNIALTGMLSNITKSYGQAALAHTLYYAVRTHFFQEAAASLHGEIVAVGLFLQLYYNRLNQKRVELAQVMARFGMPLTLEEIGVKPTSENLNILEAFLKNTVFVENTPESHCILHGAILSLSE